MSGESDLRPLRCRERAVSALGWGQTCARTRHRKGGAVGCRLVCVCGGLWLRLRARVLQQHNGLVAAVSVVENARRCRFAKVEEVENAGVSHDATGTRDSFLNDGGRSATTIGRRVTTSRGRWGRGRVRIERTLCLRTRGRSLQLEIRRSN